MKTQIINVYTRVRRALSFRKFISILTCSKPKKMNFHKHIFFTRSPLDGKYQFDGLFQIYPISLTGMPVSEQQKHFPCYIEFFTTKEDNVNLQTPYPEANELMSGMAAPLVKQDLFLSLLTTCTNHYFFRYEDFTGMWGFSIDDVKEDRDKNIESPIKCTWFVPSYGNSAIKENKVIIKFSELNIPNAKEVRFADYFMGTISHDEYFSDPITFPSIIKMFVASYLISEDDIKIEINNAMLHLNRGVELYKTRKTLSLISLFTSLETMVNLENRDFKAPRCETCNQLRYSVSKKFRDFLLKYVSRVDESKRKFNKLYSLRSKIIHTGKTLDSELLFNEVSQEKIKSEDLQLREVIQICRLSIVNWVIQNIMNSRDRNESHSDEETSN